MQPEAHLEALWNAPIAIAFLDLQGCFVRVNGAFAALSGKASEAYPGLTVGSVLPELAGACGAAFARFGSAAPSLDSARSPDGRAWRCTWVPLLEGQALTGACLLLTPLPARDVSERAGAHELPTRTPRSDTTDGEREEFLSALSHELRSPLTAIRNGVYLLNRLPELGERAKKTLAVVERQANVLTQRLDELLAPGGVKGKDQLPRPASRSVAGETPTTAAADHAAAEPAAASPKLTGRRAHILLVDDDPVLRETLARVLRLESFDVWEAENGMECLALIEQGLIPDATLLDYRMPGLDGGQVFERLKARGLQSSVVLMTAASAARELAEQHGFSHYVSKPFGVDDVLRLVTGIVNGLANPNSGQAPQRDPIGGER
jgi:CheY-like chemotaxis protein